jgi:hypothetical protein
LFGRFSSIFSSPVKGGALWQQPRPNNEEEIAGKEIWRRFTNVILLDEQIVTPIRRFEFSTSFAPCEKCRT